MIAHRRRARPEAEPGVLPGYRFWLARLAVWWELAWPVLWPPLGIAGLFAALALFDALPLLPGWLHGLALAGFAGALLWAALRARAVVRLPGLEAARRRLEARSGLAHRPLTVADDRIAAGRGDPGAEALWRAHRRRMLAGIKGLKVGLPTPGLPKLDPWALRAAVLLLFVVGLVVAWGEVPNRLLRALSPQLAGLGGAAPAVLEVWITPPDYSGMAPRFLRFGETAEGGTAARADDSPEVIEVLAGSSLLAQLHGGRGTPQLRFDDSSDFAAIDEDGFQIKSTIDKAGRMAVVQSGTTIADWAVVLIPDEPPAVEFLKPPSATPRASLRLEFTAKDDFGLDEVTATIRRAEAPESAGPAPSRAAPPSGSVPPIELKLPLPAGSPKTAKSASYHDLTAHIWAGLPVTVQLTAADAIGQTGESAAVEFILPERVFNNPLARTLIEARKLLTLNPERRRSVARTAGQVAARPGDYHDDVVVFLALKSIHDRLIRDPAESVIAEVQQLLWDTALRIEDGELSLSERALRAAQKELQDALTRETTDAELERLLDELQRAMDEYFRALAEDMRRNPEKYQGTLPPTPDMMTLERQDLQQLMDKIREMARTGAKEAARQLLSQLQNMMENLRAGIMQQGQQGQNQVGEMMKGLQELARRQQELMDQTFQRFQQGEPRRPGQGQQQGQQQGQGRGQQEGQEGSGMPGMGGRPDYGQESARQEALRRDLGEFMRRLGEMTGNIPEGLGQAEMAMRGATRELEGGFGNRAAERQGEALDRLRAGMQQALQQLAQQFGPQLGIDPNNPGLRPDEMRDPLGRSFENDGRAWGSDVQVPDEAALQRAREILDELRRRAGQSFRPNDELDYLRRLLRQF